MDVVEGLVLLVVYGAIVAAVAVATPRIGNAVAGAARWLLSRRRGTAAPAE